MRDGWGNEKMSGGGASEEKARRSQKS